MLRVRIEFENSWVLSHRDDAKLPVEAFIEAFGRKYIGVETESASYTDCSLLLSVCVTEEELRSSAKELLHEIYGAELGGDVYSIEVEVAQKRAEEQTETKSDEQEKTKPEAEGNGEEKLRSALSRILGRYAAPEAAKQDGSTEERINKLIGAADFKNIANEIKLVSAQILKHNTQKAFTFQSYLFSIGDGCGLSTYLHLLAEHIDSLGLFKFCSGEKVREIKVKAGTAGVEKALEELKRDSGSRQLLCFDISECLSVTKSREFKELLRHLEFIENKQLIAFRVPLLDRETLEEVKANLNDILYAREISIVPFSCQELRDYAARSLEDYGFSMAEDAWEIFDQRIIEEKSDGRFYGLNTVNKIVKEIMYKKQLASAKAQSETDELLIDKASIISLAAYSSDNKLSAAELLSKLIGVESIKQRIEEIVIQIQASMKDDSLERPCLHMRFVGNAGTGKTTVARLLGKILKERGILSLGNFFEYSGRDFCGRYVGETAPKVVSMCRDAYGSVMFIDEAYSLFRGNADTVDYGREALDTLVAEMENHRNDFVVIMAGYPDEMETLMKGNPGLASRMPYVIEFPNYSKEELYKIFRSMAESKFALADGFLEAVESYFMGLSDEVLESKDFSNARFARNLFERTWGKAALRRQFGDDSPLVLQKCDFEKATAEREFSSLLPRRKGVIGFN